MTFELIINDCHGTFGPSSTALEMFNDMRKARGLPTVEYIGESYRYDEDLIKIVKDLGESASKKGSKLIVVEAPIAYRNCHQIDEYDGAESVTCNPAELLYELVHDTDIANMSADQCVAKVTEWVNFTKMRE
jgi:hypothetical protein